MTRVGGSGARPGSELGYLAFERELALDGCVPFSAGMFSLFLCFRGTLLLVCLITLSRLSPDK